MLDVINYKKDWYRKNRERILEQRKEYAKLNKEKLKNYGKEYQKLNKDELKKYKKNWYEKNKVRLILLMKEYTKKNRNNINEYRKQKFKNDKLFKMSCTLRSCINVNLKKNSYIKKNTNNELLDCSFVFLKSYLESKFESWMDWKNYGKYNGELNYGWDVDHIIPLSSAKNEEELLKLFHYTNLQPLCSKINRYVKKDNVL